MSFQGERNEQARRFRDALDAISARGARALRLRFVAHSSRPECAAFFGIAPAAFDIMLLRGARELAAAFHGTPPQAPPPDRVERQEAQQLADSLDQYRELSGELEVLRSTLDQLASLSTEIRAQEALLEEESRTRGRRRDLLWRALLVVIVGIALFLYFRPRPASPVFRRVPPEQLR